MSSVGFRLTTGFLIILTLSLTLGTLSFFNTVILEQNFKSLIEHDLNVLQNAHVLQKLIVDSETGQRGFIITGDESYLQLYHIGIFKFDGLLKVEKELVSDNPDQVQRLERISEKFKEWQENAARPEIELARTIHQTTLDDHEHEISDVTNLFQVGTGKNIIIEIRNEFETFLKIENDLKDVRYENVQLAARNTVNSIIIVITISIGVGLFTAYLLSHSITRPINYLKEAADKVSKGNLDFAISSKSDDEVGELTLQFDDMRKSIKKSTEKLMQKTKELAKVNEELKTVDRMKEEFQSMVAHELRTPLTPIIGYCDALQMPNIMGKLSEQQLNSVSKISKNAKKLQELINDIFDAQKLDLGRMSFHHSQFHVSELMNDVISDAEFVIKEKNIQIIYSNEQEIILKSDKDRLSQVLINIINNATEFVPENTGVITLSVNEEKNDVVFSVKDNGPGIPPEVLDNLFKKFYQVDSSETRKHTGTGLGLAICKGIVDNLGGKIWLDSVVGVGTEFLVSIPKDRPEEKD